MNTEIGLTRKTRIAAWWIIAVGVIGAITWTIIVQFCDEVEIVSPEFGIWVLLYSLPLFSVSLLCLSVGVLLLKEKKHAYEVAMPLLLVAVLFLFLILLIYNWYLSLILIVAFFPPSILLLLSFNEKRCEDVVSSASDCEIGATDDAYSQTLT